MCGSYVRQEKGGKVIDIFSKNDKVVIQKISQINARSDYSISKNYYTDEHFMPQPSEKEICDFCEYVISKNNL